MSVDDFEFISTQQQQRLKVNAMEGTAVDYSGIPEIELEASEWANFCIYSKSIDFVKMEYLQLFQAAFYLQDLETMEVSRNKLSQEYHLYP